MEVLSKLRCGLLLVAGLFAAAWADDASFTSGEGPGTHGGEDIYNRICQGCHMPEGVGATGAGHYPKLAGDPALASWQFVALTVLGGRNGMPAFGAPPAQTAQLRSVHLSDAQIAEVVMFVRSHFGNRYKGSVTAADVAKLPHPGSGPEE